MGLDALPAELQYRIIAHGTAANALTLSCVNKRFQRICTDPLVYFDIVRRGNGQPATTQQCPDMDEFSWWESEEHDWHTAARWALADMNAQEAFSTNTSLSDGLPLASLYWLPELLVQNHRQARSSFLRPGVTSWPFKKTVDAETLTRAVWHGTYHCLCLDDPELEPLGPHTAQSPSTPLCFHSTVFFDQLRRLIPRLRYDACQPRILLTRGVQYVLQAGETSADRREVEQFSCLALGTFMIAILHHSLRRRMALAQVHGISPGGDLKPPSALNMPFKELHTNISLPFTDRMSHKTIPRIESSTCFIKSHLPVMTSSNFLAEGTWVGYYCYVLHMQTVQWDAMMDRIQFQVTADYPDHCTVTTRDRGVDSYGSFIIFGTVLKSTGLVHMTKQYDNGTVWAWHGIMTSYGIVGSWGDERFGGWFWLWKKEWPAIEIVS